MASNEDFRDNIIEIYTSYFVRIIENLRSCISFNLFIWDETAWIRDIGQFSRDGHNNQRDISQFDCDYTSKWLQMKMIFLYFLKAFCRCFIITRSYLQLPIHILVVKLNPVCDGHNANVNHSFSVPWSKPCISESWHWRALLLWP